MAFQPDIGAIGVMTLLHAFFSEYLIIFGTPIGTEGFSGRYRMEIHDFVLSGEIWTYRQDRCGIREVVRPGDHTVLERYKVNGFKIPESAWMLEYGRGFIPSALPITKANSSFQAALRHGCNFGRTFRRRHGRRLVSMELGFWLKRPYRFVCLAQRFRVWNCPTAVGSTIG